MFSIRYRNTESCDIETAFNNIEFQEYIQHVYALKDTKIALERDNKIGGFAC